jgi:hypothetical protein
MSKEEKPAAKAGGDSSALAVEVIAMRKGIVGKRKNEAGEDEPLVFSIVDCALHDEPPSKMGYAMGTPFGGPKEAWMFNAMKAHERWAVGALVTEAEFDAVLKKVCHENSFR